MKASGLTASRRFTCRANELSGIGIFYKKTENVKLEKRFLSFSLSMRLNFIRHATMKSQKLRTMFPASVCRSFSLHLISLLLLFFFLSSSVFSANRVALVIGNSGYPGEGKLASPVKDAEAMAKSLEAAGFQVILAEDSSLMEMDKALLEFSNSAKGADAAWFFYAGRGIQIKGKNYLIPVDAQVKKETQVRYMTLGLSQVFSAMESAGTPLKVIVLDCCRDNLFAKNWSKAISPGLSSVKASKGTIVAFSAPPGQVLQDGDGPNSPFTKAMTSAMKTEGKEILQVFETFGKESQINHSFDNSFVLMEKGGKKGAIVKNKPKATPPTAPKVIVSAQPVGKSTTPASPLTPSVTTPPAKNLPLTKPTVPASVTMVNQKPKVLSISSSTPPKLTEPAFPTPANPTTTMSLGNSTTEIPVAVPAPGQPDFANKGFYRNSKVFNGGPFESVVSLSVKVELMKSTQRQLLGEGKDTGWMNYDTQVAILKMQQDRQLPVTGLIDHQTAGVLKLKLPTPGAHSSIAGSNTPVTGPGNIANGSNVPGKPGVVYSPYSPGKPIDVRGGKPGDKVTDPYTNQVFLLPADFNSGGRYSVPGKTYSTTTGPNGSKRKMIPGRYYNGLGDGQSGGTQALQRELQLRQQEILRKAHKK